MEKQRVGTSLDAFDALIAGLAAAGEVATAEVTKLRRQDAVPQTAEIPVQSEIDPAARWSLPRATTPAASPAATPSARPMTRREARALREAEAARAAQHAAAPAAPATPAQTAALLEAVTPVETPEAPAARAHAAPAEVAPIGDVVEAENARRTEDLIHSHRVRVERDEEPTPLALAARPKPKPRKLRRSLFATIGALALAPSLMFVVPATADAPTDQSLFVDSNGHTAQQILSVAEDVDRPSVDQVNYVATALASIVAQAGGKDAVAAAPAIADALQTGGARSQIVETALSYLGTPYVLGGASYSGIDCSGLTMNAYAVVGIKFLHYVSAQDALGTRIPESEAQPGDLVVFNNEDHIGIYLGGGQVIAAPAPGRRVSIEGVDIWRPVGIHFTRVLPAGQ